jgi:hypothetical protein
LKLAEILLEVEGALDHDANGNVDADLLAYMEWRYISYLRFLHSMALAPWEALPPW